jgi:CRP-like cAMP-binding protein
MIETQSSVQAFTESRMQNRLLRRLAGESGGDLRPLLRSTMLVSQQVLYRPGARISKIYFPETAVLCMLTCMADGHTIESATVGREGASWISASLGFQTMPCQTMVAVGGAAYVLSTQFIEQEIEKNGAFHKVLSEYSHALLISSFRTGACNALHSLTQRCARWMLTTLDRTSEGSFTITHEFLASLLGCSRPILTGILGDLERAGGVHIRRGVIEVTDRMRLEAASCECYRVIRETFSHLKAHGS